MKLLFITRRVDRQDERAGFVIRWIEELAKSVEELHVICLEAGDTTELPSNCQLHSLGKEKGKNKFREFLRFHTLAARLVPQVDGVFTHQNPEYGILIAPWARLFRKRLVAWYVHKAVTWKLRLLHLLVDLIVTASPESCRITSKKVRIVGHGIDTDYFRPAPQLRKSTEQKQLLTVGRVSPSKHIDVMIRVVAQLVQDENDACLNIVGAPALPRDIQYKELLDGVIEERQMVERVAFIGPVPHHATASFYQQADLFLNFSETGSIDKAVLEAMSCGTPILVSNKAFQEILSFFHRDFFVDFMRDDVLCDRVEQLLNNPVTEEIRQGLRSYVVQNHNLKELIKKIVALYEF